jgi:hypothetical protein
MFNLQILTVVFKTTKNNKIPVETLAGVCIIKVKPTISDARLFDKLSKLYDYKISVDIIRNNDNINVIIQNYKDVLNRLCCNSNSDSIVDYHDKYRRYNVGNQDIYTLTDLNQPGIDLHKFIKTHAGHIRLFYDLVDSLNENTPTGYTFIRQELYNSKLKSNINGRVNHFISDYDVLNHPDDTIKMYIAGGSALAGLGGIQFGDIDIFLIGDPNISIKKHKKI